VSRDLVYTFNSPGYPWTDEELGLLQTYVTDFYPVIKEIYGDPAVSDTINIVHTPYDNYEGTYDGEETVTLRDLHKDVLCHEMVHTFHGPYHPSDEEAMARGVEIEVFDRLPQYVHPWDEAHSFPDDVFYEANNTRGIQVAILPSMALVTYQLGGYAIGKGLIENPSFLHEFNDSLYALTPNPISIVPHSVTDPILTAILPEVEGLPWMEWESRQNVLAEFTSASFGDHLYQQIGDWQFKAGRRPYPISFFTIGPGHYGPNPNTPIHWEITDWQGALLARGTTTTNASGVAFLDPPIPTSYLGLVRSVARADGFFGAIADTAYRNFGGDDSGLFGIALDGGIDSVSILNLDVPGPPIDLTVVRGAFYAPSLGPVRGRFEIAYRKRDGTSGSRRFNKDASSYLVMVGTPDVTPGGVDPLAAGHGVLLDQNRPNPFHPFTTISYHVEGEGRVGVRIFNASGRLVRTLVDEDQTPGAHEVTWDGTLEGGKAAASGVYLYRVDALGKSVTKKMIVMR